jgi:hypothetical protein
MENTCRVVVTFMRHVKHFLGKKRNEIVDKTMGDVSQVWLNSSPSATSQQMMDRHVGQIVRRDGPAVKFWIHYSSLFVHVTDRPIHFTCGSQQHLLESLSRDQPVGKTRTKDDGHLKQTRLHWLGSFIFTTLSMKMGYKVVAFLLSWPCIVRMDDVIISIFYF